MDNGPYRPSRTDPGAEQNATATGAEQQPRAIEPGAARMVLTATSRIEGSAVPSITT